MRRRGSEYLAVLFAVSICGPAIGADEKPSSAKTGPSNTKEDRNAVAVPEAAAGDITVSWKDGQICFPATSEKTSELKLQCSGNVMIEGKGIRAKATNLEVTIAEEHVLTNVAGLSFQCKGGVRIEWKGMTMEATELKYDGEKCLVTLSGGKSGSCILRRKNSDGTSSILIAEQISLSPFSSKVDCVGMREYRAVDTSPNYPPAVSGATYMPGPYPISVPSVAPSPPSGSYR